MRVNPRQHHQTPPPVTRELSRHILRALLERCTAGKLVTYALHPNKRKRRKTTTPLSKLPSSGDRGCCCCCCCCCRRRGCRRRGIVVSRLLHVEDGANSTGDSALRKVGSELDCQLLGFRLPQQSPQERNDLG